MADHRAADPSGQNPIPVPSGPPSLPEVLGQVARELASVEDVRIIAERDARLTTLGLELAQSQRAVDAERVAALTGQIAEVQEQAQQQYTFLQSGDCAARVKWVWAEYIDAHKLDMYQRSRRYVEEGLADARAIRAGLEATEAQTKAAADRITALVLFQRIWHKTRLSLSNGFLAG